MTMSTIDRGRRALESADWRAARDAFRQALAASDSAADGENAEALFGMGEALWWLGSIPEAIEFRERAYAAFRKTGNDVQAFQCALRLSVDHVASLGNRTAAAGWVKRASRLAKDSGLAPLAGWVLLLEAYLAADPEASEDAARTAHRTAREVGDVDLELCAASQIGAALVGQGRVEEGVGWLDEAMAASLGGEPGQLGTVVFSSCNTIIACRRCAEFERAVQWIRATDRFDETVGCPFLYAECRTVYGGVLVATGAWNRAEEELSAALEATEGSLPDLHAQARAGLAELRLAQGRLDEAEDLLAGLEDHPSALPVSVRLGLEKGEATRARALAKRGLSAPAIDVLHASVLRELLGEAEVARGRMREADAEARALTELGRSAECRVVLARGHRLRGRIRLAARDDRDAARPELEAALRAFAALGMPLEAGRTRMLLAGGVRETEPPVAEAEARTALEGFERLGARRDADRAAAFLRELGVRASRSGPRLGSDLTKREREVLALLARGLSNRDIGQRLFISPKTAEHHVTRILAKLGARNRAEAAAIAARGSAGPDGD